MLECLACESKSAVLFSYTLSLWRCESSRGLRCTGAAASGSLCAQIFALVDFARTLFEKEMVCQSERPLASTRVRPACRDVLLVVQSPSLFSLFVICLSRTSGRHQLTGLRRPVHSTASSREQPLLGEDVVVQVPQM